MDASLFSPDVSKLLTEHRDYSALSYRNNTPISAMASGSIGGSNGTIGATTGTPNESASLRHALGVIDKLQAQLVNLRSERNALDERGAVADLEMKRRADTISDLRRRVQVAEDRARDARSALDRKGVELGAKMEDLEDELRGCRITAEEDQARWKRSEKRMTHLEAQLALRDKRIVDLETENRALMQQAQVVDGGFQKRLAKKEEQHGNESARLVAEHEMKVDKIKEDLREQRIETDRLREIGARLQKELDTQGSMLGAERARFQEHERLAKAHEASLRDALSLAKVDVARRDERLRAAESSRTTAVKALDDAKARFNSRAEQQILSIEQANGDNVALRSELEALISKHELEMRALERHYKHDIRKLRKIAKRAIVERDEAIASSGTESDVLLQRRLVDEVIRLQAEKTESLAGSPSATSHRSPRRTSPRRGGTGSPKKSTVGSNGHLSPNVMMQERRMEASSTLDAIVAVDGGDDGKPLSDIDDLLLGDRKQDEDLEFLGHFAGTYSHRKRMPTRTSGGMSWDFDMR
jgi:hypothetical protein